MKKRFIFKSEIIGQLAHWAVRLSSYVPDFIPEMLRTSEKYIDANPPGELVINDMYGYDPEGLYQYIKHMCHTVPSIRKLNFRKEEIEAGLTDIDGHRPNIKISEGSSFVDLGALARNISNSIDREAEWNEESDKRIEAKINAVN